MFVSSESKLKDKKTADSSTISSSTPAKKEVENTPMPLPKIEKAYEAPILDGAIFVYPETKKELQDAGFSKILKKLGLENINKMNKLIPLAAKKAAQKTILYSLSGQKTSPSFTLPKRN